MTWLSSNIVVFLNNRELISLKRNSIQLGVICECFCKQTAYSMLISKQNDSFKEIISDRFISRYHDLNRKWELKRESYFGKLRLRSMPFLILFFNLSWGLVLIQKYSFQTNTNPHAYDFMFTLRYICTYTCFYVSCFLSIHVA